LKSSINVKKRDGSTEPLDYDKINKLLQFACEGLKDVSASAIALGMHVKFFDGIKTADIHDASIKTAVDLISPEAPDYQFVAARLLSYKIRKMVYGQYEPVDLLTHIKSCVKAGVYDRDILNQYTDDEIIALGKHVNHDNDDLFTYSAMKLFEDKYLLRNRETKKFYETPQFAYMLVAMTLHACEPINRLEIVVDYYNAIATGENSTISLPTPIIGGARSPLRQFSSCVLLKAGDSLNSINAVSSTIVEYAAKRAGIGVDISAIRPFGSAIRNGEATHTGVTPFIKYIQGAVKSSSQGGIRSGSATLYYPIWHKEIDKLLVLKNNKGVEDNRARHVDYSVHINGHFYKKALAREDYNLFSPKDFPDLYEAFFNDQELYAELYEKYSKSRKVKKVDAFELLNRLVDERAQTGRIYIFNVDTVNHQSAFKTPIYSSNLCSEICLPTQNLTKLGTFPADQAKALGFFNDDMQLSEFRDSFGEIALCTLSAINWGNIKRVSDFEKVAKLTVRALDNLLDYQDYPVIAAEVPGRNRRSLGVGVINLAHFLAKNGVKYGEDNALELVDEYMEAMYFYLVKASVELAKERGTCKWFTDTTYSDGTFIWENRSANVDKLIPHAPRMDWETLRSDLKQYGMRHSTLIALMPSETSSVISNATNGIEPPRSMITVKSSNDSVTKQMVPNPKLKYDYLWSQPTPDGYIKTMAVLQKYTDQSISSNTSYNPANFPDGRVPMKQLLSDILNGYKYGLKTFYYHNTYVSTAEQPDAATEGECESCKI
jgi:ribonucleoside-diphosphate reductase alpha chain